MAYEISWTPSARNDLSNAVEYIRKENSKAARELGRRILKRVAGLRTTPLVGSIFRGDPSQSIRSIVCAPYIVYYRALEKEQRVEILRIWHGSRLDPSQEDMPV